MSSAVRSWSYFSVFNTDYADIYTHAEYSIGYYGK